MKKFMKSFALLAVAALGLSACTDEKLVPDNGNADGKFVTVHFGAEAAIEGATKATLTTEDEKTFKSAWENGDVLSVEYSNDNTPVNKGIVPATWTADHFDATLPTYKGMWDYNVVYPAPDAESKVDFGSARTQKGNAYNSKYDLMKGGAIETGADAGMTADGKKIVFEMTRQTAIAYFHLTSALDEEVVSAKLSVEGNGAYLSTSDVQIGKDNKGNTSYAQGYAFTETEGVASKEISLTFTGIVPKTSDFKLWFNVLPTIYDKMTLTVETANHTLTISRNATGMYEAGKLYKVVKTIPADKWVKKVTNNNFVLHEGELVEGDYLIVYEGKAMKAAVTSGRLGYADVTVKRTRIENSDESIIWHIAPSAEYWTIFNDNTKSFAASTGAKNKAKLLADGTDDKSLWTVTKTKDAPTFEFVNKANSSANPAVNATLRNNDTYGFACYAPETGGPLSLYRLDGPVDNTVPSLSVDQSSKVWAADAMDAFVVNVTVNSEGGDWTVTPETLSWATIAVDKTDGTITVTPNGANTAQTANEATLTVTHASDASLTKEITLKQNAAGVTSYFVKVTETPTDWSGTYLIVYETDKVAFDGSLTQLDAVNNTVSVTISNNKIEATGALMKSVFTIEPSTTGKYSIKAANGSYIGRTADSNGLEAKSTKLDHTLGIDNGVLSVKSSGGPALKYNNSSDQKRFRYYKSGQKDIQLYKLDN